MVVRLLSSDRTQIDNAIAKAERRAGVHFAVIVRAFAPHTHDITFLIGLAVGTCIAVALCATTAIPWPWAIVVQLFIVVVFAYVPGIPNLCIGLLPERLRQARARHAAAADYLHVKSHVLDGKPIVLLAVSTAERSVHIMVSRSVHAAVPQQDVDQFAKDFSDRIKTKGLGFASDLTLVEIAEKLRPQFPGEAVAH